MAIRSVFISKNVSENSNFLEFCSSRDIDLLHKSFITLSGVPLSQEVDARAEVFFFGSKNAFSYFLKLQISLEGIQIACIGKATAAFIRSKGFSVAFEGTDASDVNQVAREFKFWLEDRFVSFFQSSLSKRSVSSVLPISQVQELVIYETKLTPVVLEKEMDCYVFTSPSNVLSFFLKNQLPERCIVVSWGKSTDEALSQQGRIPDFTLKTASFDELSFLLLRLL